MHLCTIDALKAASKRVIQTTAETAGDLISSKIAVVVAKSYGNRITHVSSTSHRLIQEQLQINTVNKYLKKEIYL